MYQPLIHSVFVTKQLLTTGGTAQFVFGFSGTTVRATGSSLFVLSINPQGQARPGSREKQYFEWIDCSSVVCSGCTSIFLPSLLCTVIYQAVSITRLWLTQTVCHPWAHRFPVKRTAFNTRCQNPHFDSILHAFFGCGFDFAASSAF